MKSVALGTRRRHSAIRRVAAPGLVCSCDITLTAPSQSTARAARRITSDAAAYQTRMRQAAAAAARSEIGRNDVQMAARPDPTAIAVPPSSTQSSTAQTRARASEGALAAVAARRWVTTSTAT